MPATGSARRIGAATAIGCIMAFAPAVSVAAGPTPHSVPHATYPAADTSSTGRSPQSDIGCTSYSNANHDKILIGDCVIPAGYWVMSGDNRVKLIMQKDGNLVLRAVEGDRPLWSTHTVGSNNYAKMQADGNFVVYAPGGRPLWATATQGFGNALAIQADGNLVVYAPGWMPIWASHTSL